jgi:uncharacterized membrane protein
VHALWSDEAITGLYARSLQNHSLPHAWDGRNLYCFGQPGTLTPDMYATTYPMLQFYVAWPSFEIFGPTAVAGRTPFVLIALATVPLTYLLALRLFGRRTTAGFAAFLLAGSVSFLLFSRQCRYYALTTFFTVLVLLLYNRLSLERKWTLVSFVVAALLFFHSHFLIFYCLMGGLTVAFFLEKQEKGRFWAMLTAGGLLLGLTVPWMLIFTRPYGVQEAPLSSASRLADSARLLAWFLRDCNRSAFFPVLAVPLLIVALLGRVDGKLRVSRPSFFLIIIILTQIVLVSAAGIQPTDITRDADMRYIVNLLPLMCVLLAHICGRLWKLHFAAGATTFALLLGTNLLTLQSPRCYLYDYLYELTHPYKTSTEVVIEELDKLARFDELVLVAPEYQRAPLMFYLGHKVRFCGILPADEKRVVPRQKDVLPTYIYSSEVVPDWIVEFPERRIRQDIQMHLSGEKVVYARGVLNVFWQDRSRPELMWHLFRPWPPGSYSDQEKPLLLRRKSGPAGATGL